MFSSQLPAKRAVPADELIIDFALGCCLLAVLFVGVFALYSLPRATTAHGEFVFVAGQFCAIELSYLALGNLRGNSEGFLWLKALCICGAALLAVASGGKLAFVIAGIALPPAAIGLWLRRRGFVLWQLRTISRGGD